MNCSSSSNPPMYGLEKPNFQKMSEDHKFHQRWEFRRREDDFDSSSDDSKSSPSSREQMLLSSTNLPPNGETHGQVKRQFYPRENVQHFESKQNVGGSRRKRRKEGNKKRKVGGVFDPMSMDHLKIFMGSLIEELKVARESMFGHMKEEMEKMAAAVKTPPKKSKRKNCRLKAQIHDDGSLKKRVKTKTKTKTGSYSNGFDRALPFELSESRVGNPKNSLSSNGFDEVCEKRNGHDQALEVGVKPSFHSSQPVSSPYMALPSVPSEPRVGKSKNGLFSRDFDKVYEKQDDHDQDETVEAGVKSSFHSSRPVSSPYVALPYGLSEPRVGNLKISLSSNDFDKVPEERNDLDQAVEAGVKPSFHSNHLVSSPYPALLFPLSEPRLGNPKICFPLKNFDEVFEKPNNHDQDRVIEVGVKPSFYSNHSVSSTYTLPFALSESRLRNPKISLSSNNFNEVHEKRDKVVEARVKPSFHSNHPVPSAYTELPFALSEPRQNDFDKVHEKQDDHNDDQAVDAGVKSSFCSIQPVSSPYPALPSDSSGGIPLFGLKMNGGAIRFAGGSYRFY